MAVDMFIKIDKIEGESQDSIHGKEIDVLAWSWGMSQSGTTHMGSGGGAGKVSVQDISFTKYVDSSSHALQLACYKGTHIATADLVVRKAGDNPLEYIKVNMEDIIVTSVSMGGSGGEDRLTENITLNFSKVKYNYSAQAVGGTEEAAKVAAWDIAANIAYG